MRIWNRRGIFFYLEVLILSNKKEAIFILISQPQHVSQQFEYVRGIGRFSQQNFTRKHGLSYKYFSLLYLYNNLVYSIKNGRSYQRSTFILYCRSVECPRLLRRHLSWLLTIHQNIQPNLRSMAMNTCKNIPGQPKKCRKTIPRTSPRKIKSLNLKEISSKKSWLSSSH